MITIQKSYHPNGQQTNQSPWTTPAESKQECCLKHTRLIIHVSKWDTERQRADCWFSFFQRNERIHSWHKNDRNVETTYLCAFWGFGGIGDLKLTLNQSVNKLTSQSTLQETSSWIRQPTTQETTPHEQSVNRSIRQIVQSTFSLKGICTRLLFRE